MIRRAAAAIMIAAFILVATPATAVPSTNATVILTSHRFTPSPLYLPGGVPVRLILRNRAGKAHDFTARQFFRSARLIKGRALNGEVKLRPGQSTVIDLVPMRGTYKVHCSGFGHRMLGMSTMIIVL